MVPSENLKNTYGEPLYPGDNPNSVQDIEADTALKLNLVVGHEQLITKLAKSPLLETYNYYLSLPKASGMPKRSSFNPTALSGKHLPNITLLEAVNCENRELDFRFRVFGTALAAVLGADMTGRHLSEYPGKNRTARNFAIMKAVLECKQPISTLGQVISRNGKPIQGETLVMPFGEKGKVTHILLELQYENPNKWSRSSVQQA